MFENRVIVSGSKRKLEAAQWNSDIPNHTNALERRRGLVYHKRPDKRVSSLRANLVVGNTGTKE
jgi:hypothetical protein